jgi:peptidoglycan/xylan/chitin deacetylase (PgdA/CDA1 family)
MTGYSHPDAPNVPAREVQDAIDDVDALIKELGKK